MAREQDLAFWRRRMEALEARALELERQGVTLASPEYRTVARAYVGVRGLVLDLEAALQTA